VSIVTSVILYQICLRSGCNVVVPFVLICAISDRDATSDVCHASVKL
jgi:hypothetical protein